MPDRPEHSYAHSIDPTGSIPQPHTRDGKPIEARSDFNASLPTTEKPAAPVVSQQVANTKTTQVLRPDRATYNRGAVQPHNEAKGKDDKVASQANAKAQSQIKQEAKGKAYVSPQIMDRLKQINRDALTRDRDQERGR